MNEAVKCIFCNVPRCDVLNEEGLVREENVKWVSVLCTLLAPYKEPVDIFTICPDCRGKHSIKALFEKLQENARIMLDKQKKDAEYTIARL